MSFGGRVFDLGAEYRVFKSLSVGQVSFLKPLRMAASDCCV